MDCKKRSCLGNRLCQRADLRGHWGRPEDRDRVVDKRFLDGVAGANDNSTHEVVISDGKSASSKSHSKGSVAGLVHGAVRSMAGDLKPDDVCRFIQESAGQAIGKVRPIKETGYSVAPSSVEDARIVIADVQQPDPMDLERK